MKQLESEQLQMREEISSLKRENKTMKIQMENLSAKSTYADVAKTKDPITNTQTKGQTVPPKSTERIPAKKDEKQNKNEIPFKPDQNIVISINTSSYIFNNFRHDTVRREIYNSNGPTVIEKINKYKFSSGSPRIMLQLSNTQAAKNLVHSWNPQTFGGSTARVTIDPKSLNNNSAMMRGVPIDAENFSILSDINSTYPGATLERLYKAGKILRIVKITFASKEQYKSAISTDGICLPSQHVKCQLEQIHHG